MDGDDVIDDTTNYEAVPAVEVQQATGHSLQALELLSSYLTDIRRRLTSLGLRDRVTSA